MAISIKIENQKEIQELFKKAPEKIERAARRGIQDATIFLEGETIKESPIDTGRLRGTITRSFSGFSGTVFVGTKYAKFVHGGTKPHEIRPRRGKVLFFRKNGKKIFARKVRHPGTKANPFLQIAFEKNDEKVKNIVENRIARVVKNEFK